MHLFDLPVDAAADKGLRGVACTSARGGRQSGCVGFDSSRELSSNLVACFRNSRYRNFLGRKNACDSVASG